MLFDIQLDQLATKMKQIGTGEKIKLYNSRRRIVGQGVLYKSIELEGEGNIITLCSDDYMLLQNREILTEVENSFEPDSRIIVRENMGTMNLAVFVNNEKFPGFQPGLLIKNSMNGRVRYHISPILMKLACQNGMMSRSILGSQKIWHLERNRNSLGGLIDIMEEHMEQFINQYNVINQRIDPVKFEAYLKRLNRKRLVKALEEEAPTTAQEVYDKVTNFASTQLHYNWDLIAAASSIIEIPATLI